MAPVCYFKRDGVLMMKWRPPGALLAENCEVVHQIVVSEGSYNSPLSGHLVVNKTYNRLLNHFFWPRLRHNVSDYCRSCHTCQVVGKPNHC